MEIKFKQLKLKTFTNTGISLTPVELKDFIDFDVKRIYFITDFTKATSQHCHKIEQELFICQRGKVKAIIDHGKGLEEVPMSGPEDAIVVGNYVWHGFKDASADCVLLALSSTNYSADRDDYIADYEEYRKNMPKVLILGSQGMLGQELVREFSDHKYEVIGWDKGELDITDFIVTASKISDLRPDIVINAVAYNALDKIEEDTSVFELAKKINGEAVGNLAGICKELNCTFVHYSSDNVFKGDNQAGYKEDDQVDPINKYGDTKALGEKQLLDIGGKFYLIRLSKLFGRPAISADAKKSFVDIMVYLATVGGKTHLDLVDEEISCPTYVLDLARLTRHIIEEKLPFGIYHGSNSGACSWYEWAKEIFKLKKVKIDITPVTGDKFPRPAHRPMYSQLLNTKLPQQRNWREALIEYLNK